MYIIRQGGRRLGFFFSNESASTNIFHRRKNTWNIEYTSTMGSRAVRIRQETKEMLVSTALCPDS
jgi:hypothetical protein